MQFAIIKLSLDYFNSFMPGGTKRSYLLKQTWSTNIHVCLSTHDLLLPLDIYGLRRSIFFNRLVVSLERKNISLMASWFTIYGLSCFHETIKSFGQKKKTEKGISHFEVSLCK